jgi:serine/threonine-protein kinase RsbW
MNYRFKVPCKKEKLRDIRLFVSDALKNHDLPDVQISTLVLAVDEVCANLIIHSHKCNPKEYIEIAISVDTNKNIVFDIIDNGAGFDISSYSEPSIGEIVKEKRKGGLGLILVRKIMDKIELITEDNQNICRLVKNCKP